MKDIHKKILQNSPVPYAYHKIILDEKEKPYDYEFIEINRAFEEATGLKKEEVIGNTVRKLIPGITKEHFDWIDFYGAIALGGEPKNFEQYSEPLKKWFRVYAYSPEKGTFVTHFNDISKEKEELSVLDEFFSVYLDLLCIANTEGRFIKVNQEWENTLGYSVKELEGKNFMDLVHPDDIDATLKALSSLESQNKVLNFVNRYRTKDGAYRWIEWRSTPHDELIYAAARDITAKIENENKLLVSKERLENILEATNVGTWEWNVQSGETVFNERWAEIIGYTLKELEPISIQTWANLAHPDDLILSQKSLEEHFQGKSQYYETEARLKHKNGSWVWVLDRGRVIEWDEEGKPLKMFGTHANITPRKRAEAESRRLSRAISQAAESVVITNLDGDILYVNPAFEQSSGYSREEVLGKNPRLLNSGKQSSEFYRELWDSINSGKTWEGEFVNKKKDGNIYYEEARLSPIFGPHGKIIQFIAFKHDISKQKMIEKELQEQQKLMDTLFQQSLDGFFFMMLDEPIDWARTENKDELLDFAFNNHKMIRVNQAILNQYSAKEKDFIGLTPADFFEDNIDYGKKIWRQFFDEGKIHIDTKEYKFDGTPMMIEGDYVCIYTDDGKIKGHFGIQREVTAERNAQHALEESESNFRTFFETLDDMVFVTDMDWKLIYINSSSCQKLGYKKHELIGKEAISLYQKKDRDEAKIVIKKMLNGKQDSCSIPLENKEKKLIPVESRIWRGKWNHQDCIYGISKDLSEIRSALDKFNRVFENNPALMAISSVKERKFIDVNQAFLEKMGYQRDEVIGKATTSLKMFASPELHENFYRSVLNRKEVKNIEAVVLNKQKETLYVLFSGILIPVQGDEFFLSVFVDITKQKELEKALMDAKQKAEAASKAKSEFLANMSHEIRTPLNGVIGFSEVLTRTKLSEQQKQYMNTVHSSAVLLMDIINDILDFSKIEAGKLQLNPEKMDLVEMIETVEDIIKHRAQEKKLEILLSYPPELSRFIIADPVRLRQVLVNLLGNSVKFTENGEIELKIEQKGNIFTFSVRDTGIGIAPDVQEKIFESFSQADLSTTRKYGGTGLGLSISNKLLEKMGSRLELESEPGKGSRFYFSVELEYSPEIENRRKERAGLKSALVVDDNMKSAAILSTFLKHDKIHTEIAANGIEALQKLEKNRYNIVFIDQEMPYMDGIEVIKNIREKIAGHKNFQIVLMNNRYETEQMQARLKKLDIRYYLEKPIKVSVLEKLLDRISGTNGTDVEEASVKNIQEKKSFRGISILVAEDNHVNLFLAETLISQFLPGAQVIKSENGLETVEKYIEHQPDLILMDVQMPELNGYDATREIRKYNEEHGNYVPIVALTAGAVKGEKERCLEAGMDDFLPKPIHAEKLEDILRQFLEEGPARKNRKKKGREKVHFEKKELLERLDGDMGGYQILVEMSLSTLTKKQDEYQKIDLNQDINKLKHWIHSLKGTALTMNFNCLVDLTTEMESTDLGDSAKITSLWTSVEEEIEKIKLILSNELESF